MEVIKICVMIAVPMKKYNRLAKYSPTLNQSGHRRSSNIGKINPGAHFSSGPQGYLLWLPCPMTRGSDVNTNTYKNYRELMHAKVFLREKLYYAKFTVRQRTSARLYRWKHILLLDIDVYFSRIVPWKWCRCSRLIPMISSPGITFDNQFETESNECVLVAKTIRNWFRTSKIPTVPSKINEKAYRRKNKK